MPLERLMRIHVSGPRRRDGLLVDAHEPMKAVDYALLEHLLSPTMPRMVTLEHIRGAGALRAQDERLRSIVDSASGSR